MTANSDADVAGLLKAGRAVAGVRDTVLRHIRPDITTAELDAIAQKMLDHFGAKSAPKQEYAFPGAICISVNDEVAHGIPGPRRICAGDMVNVDVSAELGGYYADTGATMVVEPAPDLKSRLCQCSQAALHKALAAAKAGNKINQLGRAIQHEAQRAGFTVIRNLAGHGIGRRLHEPPLNLVNFYARQDPSRLREGMVLAVETFVSTGAEYVKEASDGWTLKTPDSSLVAQFEHTIIVTRQRPMILTA